jgi:hypothetical protein
MTFNDIKNDKNLINKVETLLQLRWVLQLYKDEVSTILNVDYKKLRKISELSLDRSEKIRKYFDKTFEELEKINYDIFNEDYNYLSDEHIAAIQKNEDLVHKLITKRNNFCGIGTNKTKRRLNQLSVNDNVAKAIRLALEIEDKNITAKNSYGKFKNKIYDTKQKLISDLVELFQTQDNWNYGIEKNGGRETNAIIYFDIPNTEQISWHFNLCSKID